MDNFEHFPGAAVEALHGHRLPVCVYVLCGSFTQESTPFKNLKEFLILLRINRIPFSFKISW